MEAAPQLAAPPRVGARSPVRNATVRSPGRRGVRLASAPRGEEQVGSRPVTTATETATVRRLSQENRLLQEQLKELQVEAAEEKEEVHSLIDELSKEIVQLYAGLLLRVPRLSAVLSDGKIKPNAAGLQDGGEPGGAPH